MDESAGFAAELSFRAARQEDVSAIVAMLADDPLGALREKTEEPLPQTYYAAFNAINHDPNIELVVAILSDQVVGVMQITFIPYLTYQGGWRAVIEGVRISQAARSQGMGGQMLRWAITRAKERRCHMVQLTTDKTRTEALRFYEDLGFVATHHGMKLKLP